MMMKIVAQLRAPLMGASVLALSACATITTGPDQAIRVGTEPPGANCTLSRDRYAIGTVPMTPGAIYVSKSGHDIAVNCRKMGWGNGAAVIPAARQEATGGNILFGGLAGYGLDLATGAAAIYPRTVKIWLDPLFAENAQSSPSRGFK